MKEFIKYTIITLMLIFGLVMVGRYEALYKVEGIIRDANNQIITVEDTRGHLWEYKGKGQPNDEVVLTLYDNYTFQIEDDKVVKVCIK